MSTTPKNATLDVRDFPSLQDAVNALPSNGGTIHIPAGTTCSLSAAITVSKPIWFKGDGASAGSKIEASAADPNHHLFNVESGAKFTDLEIDMKATEADNYDAIRIQGGDVNGILVQNVQMYGVYIHHTPRNALRITHIYDSHFEKVLITSTYGDGILVQEATGSTDPIDGGFGILGDNNNLVFIDCRVADSHKRGFVCDRSHRLSIIACTFEGLGEAVEVDGAGGTSGTGTTDGLVYFKNCGSITYLNNHNEGAYTWPTVASQFVYFDSCSGGQVIGNSLNIIGGDVPNLQKRPTNGMTFASCGGMHIAGNRVVGVVTNGINIASSSNYMALVQGIYDASTSRDVHAGGRSTHIGLGIRPTTYANTTDRDASLNGAYQVNGTIIYLTSTNKLQVRAGGAWVDLH